MILFSWFSHDLFKPLCPLLKHNFREPQPSRYRNKVLRFSSGHYGRSLLTDSISHSVLKLVGGFHETKTSQSTMKVTGDHQPIFGPEGCQIIQVENHQPFFSSAQEQTLRHTDYHLATKGALLVPPSLTKDLQTLWAKPFYPVSFKNHLPL